MLRYNDEHMLFFKHILILLRFNITYLVLSKNNAFEIVFYYKNLLTLTDTKHENNNNHNTRYLHFVFANWTSIIIL